MNGGAWLRPLLEDARIGLGPVDIDKVDQVLYGV